MLRRHFLALAAGLAIAAPAARAGDGIISYSPGVIEQALADGKTVFVDYSATWCSTCAAQERVIDRLRAANPDYDAAITFVRVDWDGFKNHEVTTSRNIPRRSTLLVLRGENELGRLVAATGESDIKALMDKGLAPDA